MKLLIFLGLCAMLSAAEPVPNFFDVSQAIIKNVGKVFEPKGYLLKGGGGRESNGNKTLALSFAVEQAASIDEARKIYVAIAEETAKAVNNSYTMVYHFVKYPYNANQLELSISFWPAQAHKPSPLVALINMNDGMLHYTLTDPITGKKQGEHRETYKEAYQLASQGTYLGS